MLVLSFSLTDSFLKLRVATCAFLLNVEKIKLYKIMEHIGGFKRDYIKIKRF